MSAIAVDGLKKSFRRNFWSQQNLVLKNISFQVKAGSITGFLGGNGAGKTTTIKCLLNLIRFDAGQIRYFEDLEWGPAVQKRLGFLPERPYFYEYLTGREFLNFYGQLSGLRRGPDLSRQITDWLEKVSLTAAADRPLRNYSKGMLQKVGMIQAVLHRPDLLILDEPMSGLDPDGRASINDLIQQVAQSGTTVFFSSHLLPDVERICDQLVILKSGSVVFNGDTQQLLTQVGTPTEVIYRVAGSTQSSVVELMPEELQARLATLIKERAEILEVKLKRLTLEEAFIKMALRDLE